MSFLEITTGITILLVSAVLIYFAFRSKNLKKIATYIGTSVIGILFTILGIKSKQNKKLKTENNNLQNAVDDSIGKMSKIKNLQNDFKEKKDEIKVQEFIAPDNVGDRLNRLNNLHND